MNYFQSLLAKHLATYGPLCPVPEAYERDLRALLKAHQDCVLIAAALSKFAASYVTLEKP